MGEIRFVGTGETRGYPYPVCKKNLYAMCKVGVIGRYISLFKEVIIYDDLKAISA